MMVKLIVRFLIVLVVAAGIAVGMYWGIQQNSSLFGGTQGERNGPVATLQAGTPPESAGQGMHRDAEGGADLLSGLSELARNLGIIALFTLGVSFLEKIGALITHRRKAAMA